MRIEIEEELSHLGEIIKNGHLNGNGMYIFFDEWDWEDDYSHDEIRDLQIEFEEEVEPYLKKNHKGEYLIRESIVITKKYYKDNILMKNAWKQC